jgi:hypothetical protein
LHCHANDKTFSGKRRIILQRTPNTQKKAKVSPIEGVSMKTKLQTGTALALSAGSKRVRR